ncbi:efflux transporter outer membrane subunit [Pseudoduganella ginsengisoli]|nr:efflux transporter outer membrane subunit [Pseudoduganella ginsengisoli]
MTALGLAGCVAIPADKTAPAKSALHGAPASLAAIGAADIRLARDGWPDANWWQAYGDAQLDALVARALASSPSLDAAAARIALAQSAQAHAAAEGGLAAGVTGSANRQRYSGTGLFPAPIGGSWFTEASARMETRYDVDWWGKHKAQVAAAAGDVQARRAELAQAERALAASIAQSYFRLQGGWAHRANLEQRIAAQREVIADTVKRVAHGLAVDDDVRRAQADLALLNRDAAATDGANVREREALRALAGGADAADLMASLAPRALPGSGPALPSQLGMELLARRPDLQAARWRVEASLSRTDAARAAFYPDINLAASIGLNSISLERLLSLPSRTLFAGPSISLPLFDSKLLAAQLDTARQQRNGLIADYNEAVIDAVRAVAQDAATMQALEAQADQQQAVIAALAAQQAAVQRRVDAGLAGRRAALDAQLALLVQQDQQLQLRHAQALGQVALIHSLGGGYQSVPAPALTTNP